MILKSPEVTPAEFEDLTRWEIKPEGACRDGLCVPLADAWSLQATANRLGMPLVADPTHGIWALGPESGRVLRSAQAPDLELPDWRGKQFRLSSLRGQKVLLVAWAPW